jgi:hypothetical protein
MAVQYNASTVTNGLVLALDAANTQSYPGSGNIWRDLSGNGNDITLVNSPTFSTTNKGQITFNGSTQYGTVPSNTSLTFSQPTVIVACTPGVGTVIAKGRSGSYWNYGIAAPSTTFFRARNNNNDVDSLTYPTKSGINIFTAAWDGAFVNFYLNGEFLSKTNSSYSPIANNLHNLTIGVAQSGGGFFEYYGGSISYILIYNRCLSANEIKQNHDALKSRYGL